MQDLFGIELEQEVKKPILKKITLQNYRNIDYKVITVGEKGIIFQGRNGLGKTNIIEAVYRNMSGKLFSGVSKSDVQAVSPTYNPKAKTSVKLEFDKDNFTFELISYEDYKKDGTYKGTAFDYYVNEALTKKGQALDVLYHYLGIKELADKWSKDEKSNIDLIDLLFNVNYIKKVDYKWLRALVIDMVGDVEFTNIINEKPVKYGKLVQPLKDEGLNLETVKAKYRVRKFGKANAFGIDDKVLSVKEEIKNLEVKASEKYDLEEIKVAKSELEEIEKQIVDLKVKTKKGESELTSEIDLKISKLEQSILLEQNKIREEHNRVLESLKDTQLEKDIRSKEKTLSDLKNKQLSINQSLLDQTNIKNGKLNIETQQKNELERLTQSRQELLAKWKENKKPTTSEILTCPKCNEPFSLNETKEHKHIVDEKLLQIETKGKEIAKNITDIKEILDNLEVEIGLINDNIITIQTERKQVESNIEILESEILTLKQKEKESDKNTPIINLNSEKVTTLQNEIKTLKTKKESVLNDFLTVIKELNNQINELELKKEPLKQTLNKEIIIENYKKDLGLKKLELEKLQEEQIDIDDVLGLIKQLEQEKYTKIENKIKDTFGENIKFELFKENLDGSVDTRVCVMLVKDIHGNFVRVENINTGLYPIRAIEFLEKVREFYNIPKSFVFLDELSALDTNHTKMLLNSGLQIIATRPSDSDVIEEIEIK